MGSTQSLKYCCTCCGQGDSRPVRRKPSVFWSRDEPTGGSYSDFKKKALHNGGELVNVLVRKQWNYISVWFGQKMREAVQPLLKEKIHPSVVFERCDLGNKPLRIENVTTATQQESEDWENILIIGDLEYQGNGHIRVALDTALGSACVDLTRLEVRGKIAIEFVKLTSMAPWFTGLRIYFPQSPHVDLEVDGSLTIVTRMKNTGVIRKVKEKLLKILRSVIDEYAVLPNRYLVELLRGADPIFLKHPRPQGLLRIMIVEHKAAKKKAEMPRDRSGSFGLLADSGLDSLDETSPKSETQETPKRQVTRLKTKCYLDTRAAITVGAITKRCALNEVCEFCVADYDHQAVRIHVFQADGQEADFGSSEELVKTLVAKQSPDQASEGSQDLTSEGDRMGNLKYKAQYRPICSTNQISKSLSDKATWALGLGDQSSAAWLLRVGIFHVTGLHPVGDNVEIWPFLLVKEVDSEHRIVEQELRRYAVSASTPASIAIKNLQASLNNELPSEAEQILREHVPAETWRELAGTNQALEGTGDFRSEGTAGARISDYGYHRTVDVVWNRPFEILLGRDALLIEEIRALELVIDIRQSEKGKDRTSSSSVGTVRCKLANVLTTTEYSETTTGLLSSGTGYLTYRAQVRPFLAAEAVQSTSKTRKAWETVRRVTMALHLPLRTAGAKEESDSATGGDSTELTPLDSDAPSRIGRIAQGARGLVSWIWRRRDNEQADAQDASDPE